MCQSSSEFVMGKIILSIFTTPNTTSSNFLLLHHDIVLVLNDLCIIDCVEGSLLMTREGGRKVSCRALWSIYNSYTIHYHCILSHYFLFVYVSCMFTDAYT